MRVLGIDPGTSTVGWGVIDGTDSKLRLVAYGKISLSADLSFPEKLKEISEEIKKVIHKHKPEALSIEEPFLAQNPKASLRIGQVVGAIEITALNSGIEVTGYSVLEIKQAVVGYGRADKEQVQHMVKVLLHLEKIPEPKDAADALAVAICHQHSESGLSNLT
jgi:crossover junction endodeoxyribonuclease RuvC